MKSKINKCLFLIAWLSIIFSCGTNQESTKNIVSKNSSKNNPQDSFNKNIPNRYNVQKSNSLTKRLQSNGKVTSKENIPNTKILKYKSTYNDVEDGNGNKLNTENKISYHIFDFNTKTVTYKDIYNNKEFSITYRIKKLYKEPSAAGTNYIMEIYEMGVKKIRINLDIPNIGYDYDDGKRVAYYRVMQLN